MREINVVIDELKQVKPDVFLLNFKSANIAKKIKPFQFFNLKVDTQATILRRPISVHRVDGDDIYLLFRVRGRGTKILAAKKKGDILNILGPLGNGLKLTSQFQKTKLNILVAGGIGVAPLFFLGQRLKRQTVNSLEPDFVLLGAAKEGDILCEREFKKIGYKVLVATEDGSRGIKANVLELLTRKLSDLAVSCGDPKKLSVNIYSCGPKPMLLAIKPVIRRYPNVQAKISLEQFIGCGVGACCGCTIETKQGYKKICKDGPLFKLEDIV
ncbi:MAG: dihydroorotate dehydrogenase electron transfer subunit [Candidatus Omnitrophica bacterium]|nr:dihydroorotate dehydrogenase electron transfer subunit [Candidatus Omnitrophota bacterium]